MIKNLFFLTIVLSVCFLHLPGHAKISPHMKQAVRATYTPAEPHEALENASQNIDTSKLRSYVVMKQNGIHAERALFFISWDDHRYHKVIIDTAQDHTIITKVRRPYTFLKRGDVMIVTGLQLARNTVFLKLMSADIYIPENRANEKHHSRVTVKLGFRFPKTVFENDDTQTVLTEIAKWIKPFPNKEAALAYALTMGKGKTNLSDNSPPRVIQTSHKSVTRKFSKQAAKTPQQNTRAEDKRIGHLEKKMELLQLQMLKAQKELEALKD